MRTKKKEDRRLRTVLVDLTRNMKPFNGGKDEHFLSWWTGILEVTRFMGKMTELLTGEVLFNLLGEDVRATLGVKSVDFGTLDLGASEDVLFSCFLRAGEERYDKLFSWRFDESKSFYVNLSKFNSLAQTSGCKASL